MESTTRFFKLNLLLTILSIFAVACNKDDDSGTTPTPTPDLTVKVQGNYIGTWVETLGTSVVTIDSLEMVVTKVSEDEINLYFSVEGIGDGEFNANMDDETQFTVPNAVFGDWTIEGMGSLENGNTLKFELSDASKPDYSVVYEGERK